jgi:hypothetical protein
MASEKLTAVIDADTKGLLRGMIRAQLETAKFSGRIAKSGANVDRHTKSLRRLGQSVAGVAAAYISFRAAQQAVGQIVKMGRAILGAASEYEILRARLAQMLGSQDAANKKFAELQQLAASTPNQIDDIADAFIRLNAAGFEVDVNDFRTLGDLAAASNKPLAELADAMISAGRGQAAMVDNFVGLAGKAEGGALTLTNAMAGTRVEGIRSKDAIREFFLAAGRTKQVEGAMDRLSKTAKGKMSTFGDVFKNAKATIGDRFLPAYKAAIDTATERMAKFTPRLAALGDSIMAGFSPQAIDDFKAAMEPLSKLFGEAITTVINKIAELGEDLPELAKGLRETFSAQNVEKFRDIVVEIAEAMKFIGGVMVEIVSIAPKIVAGYIAIGAAVGDMLDKVSEGISDFLTQPIIGQLADTLGLFNLGDLGGPDAPRQPGAGADFRGEFGHAFDVGRAGFIIGQAGDESAILRTILDLFDRELLPILRGTQ